MGTFKEEFKYLLLEMQLLILLCQLHSTFCGEWSIHCN